MHTDTPHTHIGGSPALGSPVQPEKKKKKKKIYKLLLII